MIQDVIDYENGEMDEDRLITWFQGLIDSNAIFHLQGSYQRTAVSLCEAGLCHGLELRGMTLFKVEPLLAKG